MIKSEFSSSFIGKTSTGSKVSLPPIRANREPSVDDKTDVGRMFIDTTTNKVYVLSGIIAGEAKWSEVASSTGSGSFTDLEATGAVTFNSSSAVSSQSLTTTDILAGDDLTLNSSTGNVAIGDNTAAQTVQLGGGAGSKTVAIGSTNTTSGTVIQSGTSGIQLNAAGLLSIEAATDTQAAAAVTINAYIGKAVFTGLTTAAAASQILTITNSVCATTSGVICEVTTTDAVPLTKEYVRPAAGSFTVQYTNNSGAAALNADVIVSFIIVD